MPNPILLYLSYGAGPHVDEAIFSVLSATRQRRPTDPFDIVILTDDPAPYAGLPVVIEHVPAEHLTEWGGPLNFGHRRKIMALAHALRRFAVPVVMIDADTYFHCSPARLFGRVGKGRSLMHLREGELGYLVAHGYMKQRLPGLSFTLADGERYELTKESPMHNAGVVGIHPDDAGLVDKTRELADAIHAAAASWLSEQLAFSCVLNRHTQVSSCRDVIFHYHEWFIRNPFRERLPDWMRETATLPVGARADALHLRRPKSPLGKKLRAIIKRPLKRLGYHRHDLNTST